MNETHGPWLRAAKNSARYMMDVEVALLALLGFSFACYGWRPVVLTALSVLAAVFCELLGNAMRHQRPSVFDGAALVTGTTVGLLMSPITAYWVPVLASAFAVVVVKLPFGGTGRNLFNPAAAGMALATQCFPTRVFTYPNIAAMNGELPLGALPEGGWRELTADEVRCKGKLQLFRPALGQDQRSDRRDRRFGAGRGGAVFVLAPHRLAGNHRAVPCGVRAHFGAVSAQ